MEEFQTTHYHLLALSFQHGGCAKTTFHMHDGSDELDWSRGAVFAMKFSFMASRDIFFIVLCHRGSLFEYRTNSFHLNRKQKGDLEMLSDII